MKVTNNLGLPEPIVRAVENDPYDNNGTLSVTTLLSPPQQYALKQRYGGDITEDASDRVWALVGQIGHLIIERAAGKLDPAKWVTERRFIMDIDGERFSGQADLVEVDAATVFDAKFTSGWAVKDAMANGKTDWQMQLSMLAMLARGGRYMEKNEHGTWIEYQGPPIEISHGKIIAIVRDWTETQALRNPDWPQRNIQVIDMSILSEEETMAWIRSRIAEFKEAAALRPRPCTDEERWHNPGKWAVHKKGVLKAAKLADTEDELSAWIFANKAKVGNDYRIEQREGIYKRCEKYCAVSKWCQQHQRDKVPEALAGEPDSPADMS
jgi:hypothetical protein